MLPNLIWPNSITIPDRATTHLYEKAHRGLYPSQRNQRSLCEGEIHSAWAPIHSAFVVGEAAVSGGEGDAFLSTC